MNLAAAVAVLGLLGAELPPPGATAAPDALIGVWEPVERSMGGMGSVLELTRDGRYIQTMTALVDGFYRIDGDRLFRRIGQTTAENPKEAVRFAIDGDALTTTGSDGSSMHRERIGPAPTDGPRIVGTWRYPYANGPQKAYERYDADSRFEFRLPMASEKGPYRVEGNMIVFTMRNGPENPVPFEVHGDRLILHPKGTNHGSELRRIGETSWYDRDVDNVAARRAVDPQARQQAADQALAKASTPEARWWALPDAALCNAETGPAERATALANELLEAAAYRPNDENLGTAVHKGNLALGLVAIRAGRMDEAKARLLAAGNVSASGSLDSFGPNMSLAKALLEKGEKDTVLQYLELCRKFWKMDRGALDRWAREIRAGSVPNFGANLLY